MAKRRYHESEKTMMSHSGFMKDGHGFGPEYYAGRDPRRMQERRDGDMIHEDHSAPANLPQAPMLKYWPREGGYLPEVLDDTIGGIDAQMRLDDSQRAKNFKPKKV